MGSVSRRSFLQSAGVCAAGLLVAPSTIQAQRRQTLADRFSDLKRHFLFEYYPWYRTNPWEHWEWAGHKPPLDLSSNYVPALGPYDSRSTAVLEQHARWIADAGVGAIDVSWWGPESRDNEVIPRLMDVMAAHDIHVAFYIEPYSDDHPRTYSNDILYLIRNYGDRRKWDCFLLLENEDGSTGPVFKSFQTIRPPTSTDCRGVTGAVADYVTDDVWRRQTDAVRELFRRDFDRITLLADSLTEVRTQACGFDGIALFDNFVTPDSWRKYAEQFTTRNLVFSFQVNPGFDMVVRRDADGDACYKLLPFSPGSGTYDWSRGADRASAQAASRSRIVESFNTTVGLQTTPGLTNMKKGFFLVYINSFNEWHEGHQFEPAKHRAELTDAERAHGYHNPDVGSYRLETLRDLVRGVLDE